MSRWDSLRARASARTTRLVGWWALLLVLVIVTVLGDEDEPESEPEAPVAVEAPADGKLRISSIKPVNVFPGSAVVIDHGPLDPTIATDVRVEIAKRPTEILHQGHRQLVVRVPSDMATGQAKIRIFHGDKRSKPKDIRIKAQRFRRIVRNLVGGLALFIFGLRTLARGLRGYAGHPLRAAIGLWTRGSARGLGFGVLTGGIGQSVISVVAFVLGLLQNRMLTFSAALAVLLGAHLGASAAILVLPLGLSRQSLWVVGLGVIFIVFSRKGRGESAGRVLLGVGLLLHGLGILRTGFEPLMGDPDVLPYLQAFQGEGLAGLGSRVLGGTVLGALLQAPGAVFGLVLGIGESTALLTPRQGLELMAGANIGMSLGTVVLALPFGRVARRLALAHLALAIACTAIFLVIVVPCLAASAALLPTDPNELAYGKKVIAPHLAEHLSLSFVMAQAIAVVLLLPLVGPLSAALLRVLPERRRLGRVTDTSPERLASDALVRILESNTQAMTAILATLRTGARQELSTVGETIAKVRAELKDVITQIAALPIDAEHVELSACVNALRMQQALEQLQRLAERGLDKDYRVDGPAIEAFDELHELARGSITAMLRHLEGAEPMDIEQARTRELETNTREAQLRQRLLASLSEQAGHERDVLWWIEVIGAYEGLGNHVYRLAEALVDPEDEF